MSATWVFGYGSLVSPQSMARTIGRVPTRGADFLPARLDGYGRRWNYGVGSLRGRWTSDEGRVVADGTIVALGVVRAASEAANGVVARVDAEELAGLDLRERDYDRVVVTELVAVDGPWDDADRVVTYVPRPSAIARYETARDAGRAAIRRDYWDLVEAAFAEFGDDALAEYRRSTPPPDIPVHEIEY